MVYFKAEANQTIGGGHLQRCISLATDFLRSGINSSFIFSNSSEISIQRVRELNFPVYTIQSKHELNFAYYVEIIPNGSILIFDTDDSNYYSGNLIDKLRESKIITACFTITDKFYISTDVLINPNIISATHKYKTPIYTHKLLGPEFMIFSDSIREAMISERTHVSNTNLFMFFGTADPAHLTTYFINVLKSISYKFKKIFVLVGSLNPEINKIESIIENQNPTTFELYYNLSDVSPLYNKSDLAITTAGMTMWELALYKVPQLVIASSERELMYSKYLNELKFIEFMGHYNDLLKPNIMSSFLDDLLSSRKLDTLKIDNFRSSINLYGIKSITKYLISLMSK